MARLNRELPLRSLLPLYTESSAPSSLHPIPRVVHQTWVSTDVGRTHFRSLAAFRSRNLEFGFRFYDEDAMDDFMDEHFGDHPVIVPYRQANFGPLRTDIWRYCVMYSVGGVYCDIGKSIDAPLSAVTGDARVVVSWEERTPEPVEASVAAVKLLQHPHRRVINWALMAEPRHRLFELAIDRIVAKYPAYQSKIFPDAKRAILEFTGPIHLTECLHLLASEDGLQGVRQTDFCFDGMGSWEAPGSWVRYAERSSYALARDVVIVN